MIHALLHVHRITLVRIKTPTIIVVCPVKVIFITKLVLCNLGSIHRQINIIRRITRRREVREEASTWSTGEHSHFRTNVLAGVATLVTDPTRPERRETFTCFTPFSCRSQVR